MTTLQDVCIQVTDGKHGDCRNEGDSQYYFISCKDVKDGRINYSGARQITQADFIDTHRRTKLEACDILITNSGTIGRMAFVPNAPETERTTFQKSVAILKPNKDEVVPIWLYYFLLAKNELLIAWAGGTAQKNLLLRDLRAFEVSVPPVQTQIAIASILSAYDDLLDNNLRRIKILEEMAQNLYREWFVKFRFPGHEKVRMVDSRLGKMPMGWEVIVLGGHLAALESGKRPKGGVGSVTYGIPSIGAENVNGIGRHNYAKEKLVSEDFYYGMKKGVVQNGDVGLYKDGANIGRSTYFRDGFPHEKCCINEHVFLLRSTGEKLSQNFLYLWLREPAVIDTIRATNSNAAQPGLNQKSIKGLRLVVPNEAIAESFSDVVEPMLALIVAIAKKNRLLGDARDILLPKLISGELDVSEPDIEAPEEAA